MAAMSTVMTVRVPLKHLALISVTGEECNVFLQGQLSNDIRELTATRAQLSSLNSSKGRVLAVLQLVRYGNGVLMLVPATIAESVAEHLAKYVLRSKAKVEVAAGMSCFGLIGTRANDSLDQFGSASVDRDWQSVAPDGLVVWQTLSTAVQRIIVAGPTKKVTAAYDSLRDTPVGDIHMWRLHDLLAGLPEILPPTQDKFVAQMLRLDDLGAIDFDKGCYTGQEVIARAHYLGKVKRGSKVGRTQGKRPLKPAEPLKVDGELAALVVSSAPDPDGGQVVMAVQHKEFPDGTVFTAADGVEVTL